MVFGHRCQGICPSIKNIHCQVPQASQTMTETKPFQKHRGANLSRVTLFTFSFTLPPFHIFIVSPFYLFALPTVHLFTISPIYPFFYLFTLSSLHRRRRMAQCQHRRCAQPTSPHNGAEADFPLLGIWRTAYRESCDGLLRSPL